jgi:thiol-disulfide isomerase/thioredoxin
VVASTLDGSTCFEKEEAISANYTDKHMAQIFKEGFSFSGFEKDKVWLNLGDQYLDVADVSGADDEGDGRALCVADFDDDGDPDFFVHNTSRERHMLYRNDVNAGARGITVQLKATKGQWEAFGAIVKAKSGERNTAQLLSCGSGFASQNAPELYFGTSDGVGAEVTVHWPGRAVESFGQLAAGGKYLLVEGAGKATALARKSFKLKDPGVAGLRVALGASLGTLPVVGADGKPADLALGGRKKPLVVNLWATYCAACVGEMADLQKLSDRGDREVVAICLDDAADRARAGKLLDGQGVKFPRLFATPEFMQKLIDLERMPMPTTLFFDEKGVLVEVLQTTIDHWSGFKAK